MKGSDFVILAKTGTTDGGRDAWLAGFLVMRKALSQHTLHPRITFVVWAGYPDNRAADLYGGEVHGPVFRRFLQDTRVHATFAKLLNTKRSVQIVRNGSGR